MANSDDGSLLMFTGADTTNTSVNANTVANRSVSTINSSYTFTVFMLQRIKEPVEIKLGAPLLLIIYTFILAIREDFILIQALRRALQVIFFSVKSFGGTVYALIKASGIGTISATSGGTFTATSNSTVAGGNDADFYFISSGSNGSTFDILYVIENSSASAGQIDKYSLVSGTWTANGTAFSTGFGGKSIVAATNGSGGAYLYVVTKDMGQLQRML